MNVGEFLPNISEKLQNSANVKSIYGEPIEREGKTIIPIAKIRYGFGAGGGTKGKGSDQTNEGGGGGGGMMALPVGVLEVSAGETRLIPFNDFRRSVTLFFVGFIVGRLLKRN